MTAATGTRARTYLRTIVGVLLLAAAGCTAAGNGDGDTPSYAVGDTGPAGGVVYFVSAEPFPCGENLANLCNYLEAAPATADADRAWAEEPYVSSEVDGADATAIGTGAKNTAEILAQGNTDPATSAAAYAAAYELNGFDDWYLPSKDEVYELYEQMIDAGTSTGANYWSSSEYALNTTWTQDASNGPQYRRMKFDTISVRPVRAFSGASGNDDTGTTGSSEAGSSTRVPVTDINRFEGLKYAVRDTGPAGGIVFYASLRPFPCGENLADLCNYLEASPENAEVRRPWGDSERTGAAGSDFGTGHANTSRILAQGNTDPATSAAAYAAAYELNGFDDWYLPSRDECHELVIAREVIGGFQSDTYWTSTERDVMKAWYQSFKTSFQFSDPKGNEYLVRPVRAF